VAPLPPEQPPAAPQTAQQPAFVDISINGKVYRMPVGSTLEVPVNKKRAKITVVNTSQQ
jgi:hypothetical protein